MTRTWCRPRVWSRCCGWPRPRGPARPAGGALSVLPGRTHGEDGLRGRGDARRRGQHRRPGPAAPRRDGQGCFAGSGRPRRWARSCAVHLTATSSSSTRSTARLMAGLAAAVPGLLAGDSGRWRSSMSTTPSAQVHGYAKQGAAYGYSRGEGAERAAAPRLHAGVGAGDRPGPAAGRQHRVSGRCGRLVAQAVDHHSRRRRHRAGPGPGRLRLLRLGVRRCRAHGRRLVLGHRPDDSDRHRRDRRRSPRRRGPRSGTRTRSGTRRSTADVSDAEVAETSFTAFTGRRDQ